MAIQDAQEDFPSMLHAHIDAHGLSTQVYAIYATVDHSHTSHTIRAWTALEIIYEDYISAT